MIRSSTNTTALCCSIARFQFPDLRLVTSSMSLPLTLSQFTSFSDRVLIAATAGRKLWTSIEATSRPIYNASSNLPPLFCSCSIRPATLSMCFRMSSRHIVYRIVPSSHTLDIRLTIVFESNRVFSFSIRSIGLLIHDLKTRSALSLTAETIMLLDCWQCSSVALQPVSFEFKPFSPSVFVSNTLTRPFARIAASTWIRVLTLIVDWFYPVFCAIRNFRNELESSRTYF